MFKSREQVFLRKTIFINILAGIFLSVPCIAQTGLKDSTSINSKNALVIQAQIHVGKLIKMNSYFLPSDQVNLNELSVSYQTTGKKEWHQLYRYPQIGLSFFYGYWGNDKVLGRNLALVPTIAFETHTKKRWTLQTRLGLGFTYFTKHYDAISNPTNYLIGSSITNLSFFTENIYYKLSEHVNINIGVSAFHSSDGHYQLPNLGANVPSLNVGIRYFPKAVPVFYKHDSVVKPNKKIVLHFFAGYARHEFGSATKPAGGPKYPVFQGALFISKRYKKISNFQAGVSLAYYTDYYDFIVNQEYFDSHEHLNATVVTAFIGNEFIIGKFGLIAQSGINIYNPFLKKVNDLKAEKDYPSLYVSNKIGVQYYIFDPTLKPRKNIYFGIYMKANFGTADYAQLGIGTTF